MPLHSFSLDTREDVRCKTPVARVSFSDHPRVIPPPPDLRRRRSIIRRRAHRLWEHEGRPEGRALDHWLRAEREVDTGLVSIWDRAT